MVPKKVVYIFAEQDRDFAEELDKHLITLKRQKLIESWSAGELFAGDHQNAEIEKHLDQADIILLLLSVDFLTSSHAYDVQMMRAMERHRQGEAKVIPIMLRAADYEGEAFKELQALPRDLTPIEQRKDKNAAWMEIVIEIREYLTISQISLVESEINLDELGADDFSLQSHILIPQSSPRPKERKNKKNAIARIMKLSIKSPADPFISALIKSDIDRMIFLHEITMHVDSLEKARILKLVPANACMSGLIFHQSYDLLMPRKVGY